MNNIPQNIPSGSCRCDPQPAREASASNVNETGTRHGYFDSEHRFHVYRAIPALIIKPLTLVSWVQGMHAPDDGSDKNVFEIHLEPASCKNVFEIHLEPASCYPTHDAYRNHLRATVRQLASRPKYELP